MKSWLKITLKVMISIALFFILFTFLDIRTFLANAPEGAVRPSGCYTHISSLNIWIPCETISGDMVLIILLLISILIVFLIDWIIGRIKK